MIAFGVYNLNYASLDSISIENMSNQIQSQSKDGSLIVGSIIEGGSFIRSQRASIQITCLRAEMRGVIDAFTANPNTTFALVFPRAISLFGEAQSTTYNVKIRSLGQVGKNEVNGFSSYSILISGEAVNLLDQIITFPDITDKNTILGTFELNATASSGLPITYINNTPAIISISGTTVAYLMDGSASITATQSGNSIYNPAPSVTDTFNVFTSDPYWSNVVLAMHMDGANNSTTFTDLKGHTVTPFGNAKISTTQSKFGGSSAYFDGNGDYLQIPPSTDFYLTGADFTIECWIKIGVLNTRKSVVGTRTGGSLDNGFELAVLADNTINFYYTTGTGIGGGTIDLNWNHVAIVRYNNYYTIFVNGLGSSSVFVASNGSDEMDFLWIGKTAFSLNYFSGFIDDLRITKGVARYTSNFTPPTQAFPNS